MSTHTQCRLRRGNTIQTSYIPSQIAILDGAVDLKEPDGTWDRGWTVTFVSPTSMDSRYVAERSQDYKKTRKASDV